MKNDLVKDTQSIAARLVHGQHDAVESCLAEQDLRATATRYFLGILRVCIAAAIRRLFGAVSSTLSTPRYDQPLRDHNSPALR
jgi:hypothetical protein